MGAINFPPIIGYIFLAFRFIFTLVILSSIFAVIYFTILRKVNKNTKTIILVTSIFLILFASAFYSNPENISQLSFQLQNKNAEKLWTQAINNNDPIICDKLGAKARYPSFDVDLVNGFRKITTINRWNCHLKLAVINEDVSYCENVINWDGEYTDSYLSCLHGYAATINNKELCELILQKDSKYFTQKQKIYSTCLNYFGRDLAKELWDQAISNLDESKCIDIEESTHSWSDYDVTRVNLISTAGLGTAECITQIGLIKNDISYCSKINKKKSFKKENCLLEFAYALEDPSFCEQIDITRHKTKHLFCFDYIKMKQAIKDNDVESCQDLFYADNFLKHRCSDRVLNQEI